MSAGAKADPIVDIGSAGARGGGGGAVGAPNPGFPLHYTYSWYNIIIIIIIIIVITIMPFRRRRYREIASAFRYQLLSLSFYICRFDGVVQTLLQLGAVRNVFRLF